MLRTGKVGLRARDEADVAVLHAELYEDIATYMIADSRPWRPLSAGSPASPYAIGEPGDDLALFSVVELAGGELAGGELRKAGWVNGDFADEVILGLLASDWAGARLGGA